MSDHLFAWKEVASLTWYGPYANRELAEEGRQRIQRDAPWRKLRLVGCTTSDGVKFFELGAGKSPAAEVPK